MTIKRNKYSCLHCVHVVTYDMQLLYVIPPHFVSADSLTFLYQYPLSALKFHVLPS